MSEDYSDIDAYVKELDHEQLVHDVNNEITLFHATSDPRFFWKAFVLLREAGEPIPESFMRQITVWGNALIPAATPHQVAAALQMTGNGKRHIGPKHSAAYERRWRIASEVKRVSEFYKITITKAVATVARNNSLTVAKVKKAYHDTFTAPVTKTKNTSKETARALDSALNSWR